MTVITERDARHGKYLVFKDPKLEVKIRSINATEDWLDECLKVDEALADCEANPEDREKRKTYNHALYDCFFAYDPDINRADFEDKVTAAQIVEAFRVMREQFDPFVQTQKRKEKEREQQLTESLRVIEALPKEIADKLPELIEKEGGLKL
jgi:hypothetical protein